MLVLDSFCLSSLKKRDSQRWGPFNNALRDPSFGGARSGNPAFAMMIEEVVRLIRRQEKMTKESRMSSFLVDHLGAKI